MAHPQIVEGPLYHYPVIRHVAQRRVNDCGIACLAMLTGQTYEEAHAQVIRLHARRWGHGITRLTMTQLLAERGYLVGTRQRGAAGALAAMNLAEVLCDRDQHGFHWVVLRGCGRLHDPAVEVPVFHVAPLSLYHRVRAVSPVTFAPVRLA